MDKIIDGIVTYEIVTSHYGQSILFEKFYRSPIKSIYNYHGCYHRQRNSSTIDDDFYWIHKKLI